MKRFGTLLVTCAVVASGIAAFGELPDAFVEYVESDGSAYYDTGIVASPAHTKMWVVLAPTSLPTKECSVFGARSSTTVAGSDAAYVYFSSGKFRGDWIGAKTTTDEAVLNRVYRFYCEKNTVQVDDALLTGSKAKNEDGSATIYLFAANGNGAVLKSGLPQRLYGARISADGESLSADYLPCVKNDADGKPVAALYNRVTGDICYPTDGTLTAGPVVDSTTRKTFVGVVGDDWQKAENWLPAGVPTKDDDVIVPDGRIAVSAVSVAAKSLTVAAGAMLTVGCKLENYWAADNLLPQGDDGLPLAVDIKDDMVIAGCFGFGGKQSVRENESISVGGDFSLTGNARVCLYPGTFACTKDEYTFAKIYASAMQVTVGGAFSLGGTSVLSPYADHVTGKAIKFSCVDFAVDVSAKVDAADGGWNWTKYRDDNISDFDTVDVDPRSTFSGQAYNTKRYYYVLSPNPIEIYASGDNAGYGGGDKAYGYPYAPFLPGSPSGCRKEPVAGGGVVWVAASGTIRVDGKIMAKGNSNYYGACSGGGIWLCGAKVSFGEMSEMNAAGAKNTYSSSTGGGSGGRISVGVGLAGEQIDALAAGGDPTELGLEALDGCMLCPACNVEGGEGGKKDPSGAPIKGASGSVTTVYGGGADVSISVTAEPSEIGIVTPGYGSATVPQNSSQTFTAETLAYETDSIRYVCNGWVVSNATEEVARGDTNEAMFNAGTKALTFYWIWGDCEKCFDVSVPEHAKMVVDGVEYVETSKVWGKDGANATLSVVPDDGYEFLCWEGEVPYGAAAANPLVLAIGEMRKVTPILRAVSDSTIRTFDASDAKTVKAWNDPTAWDPEGVPGPNDNLVLAGKGTLLVSNYLACASLTMGGSAMLKLAETASDKLEEAALVVAGDLVMTDTASLLVASRNQHCHGRLSVGGDLVLNGTNTLTVSAGPVDDAEFSHETGGGFVTVGGDLTVGGNSTVIPNSEPWTGGSVVFTVQGDFILSTNAAFKANHNGFERVPGCDPITLGPGFGESHSIAAGYGGFGGGHNDTYGKTYGLTLAPIHPGSPSGDYNGGYPGGGLIRVHAEGKVRLEGELDASAHVLTNGASSASGGGIWVTAGGKMAVLPGAALKARGGYQCTKAASSGGGGRIALAQMLSTSQLAAMMADDAYHGPGKASRHVFDDGAFLETHPGVFIDLLAGDGSSGDGRGTFRFVDATKIGIVIIVR